MEQLTEFLVKSVVKKPDMVSVVTIQVLVDSDDMGSVIGKNGMIASAIRTIVQASSYMNNEPRVKIEIDSF